MNFLYLPVYKPPEISVFWGCAWYCPKHRQRVSDDITDDTEGRNTAHLCVHLTAPILPEAPASLHWASNLATIKIRKKKGKEGK